MNKNANKNPSDKRPLRVLSIDFDFFQIADPHILTTCYPDGTDQPTPISTIIWASHYADPGTKSQLDSVTCDTENLKRLIQIIKDQTNPHIPTLICNSHRNIYDFIRSHDDGRERINLINIDMHHDCFNNNNKLDCGNWIQFLKRSYKTRLTWITQPSSLDLYGLTDAFHMNIHTDLKKIQRRQFDLIFLCRSDNWFPPHLDPYFKKAADILSQNTDELYLEKNILKEREFQELSKTMRNDLINAIGGTT